MLRAFTFFSIKKKLDSICGKCMGLQILRQRFNSVSSFPTHSLYRNLWECNLIGRVLACRARSYGFKSRFSRQCSLFGAGD